MAFSSREVPAYEANVPAIVPAESGNGRNVRGRFQRRGSNGAPTTNVPQSLDGDRRIARRQQGRERGRRTVECRGGADARRERSTASVGVRDRPAPVRRLRKVSQGLPGNPLAGEGP